MLPYGIAGDEGSMRNCSRYGCIRGLLAPSPGVLTGCAEPRSKSFATRPTTLTAYRFSTPQIQAVRDGTQFAIQYCCYAVFISRMAGNEANSVRPATARIAP